MAEYRLYEGNNFTLWTEIADIHEFYQDDNPGDIKTSLLLDKYRASVVELRTDHRTASTLDELFDINSLKNSIYSQGDYDARAITIIFSRNTSLLAMLETLGENDYSETNGFSYYDDSGISCALSLIRCGPYYFITLNRNIHADYTEQAITFICPEIFVSTYYPAMQTKHHEQCLTEQEIMANLKPKIGSQRVADLVSTVFIDGKISEAKFSELKHRIRLPSLDNRDLVVNKLPKLIAIVETFDPIVAEELKDTVKKDYVDFFRQERYEALLKGLITLAEGKSVDATIIDELHQYYLALLAGQIYYDEKFDYTAQGVSTEQIEFLSSKIHTLSAVDEKKSAQLVQTILSVFADIHFQKLVVDCHHLIYDCEFEAIAEDAKHKLNAISADLLSLTRNEQLERTKLVEELITKIQADTRLAKRKKLFESKLVTLEACLRSCQNIYVVNEVNDKIDFFSKNLGNLTQLSLEEHDKINDFLDAMMSLVQDNTPKALSAVKRFYENYSLSEIAPEQSPKLLLNADFLALNQLDLALSKHEHTVIQDQQLVSTFGPAPHQVNIWCLHDTELRYPVGPSLQLFLTEVLQNIQVKMATHTITKEGCQAALHQTMVTMSDQIQDILGASSNLSQAELIGEVAFLQTSGTGLLIKNMASHVKTTAPSRGPIQSNVVFFDRSQSRVSTIESRQLDTMFRCNRLKTSFCSDIHQSPDAKIIQEVLNTEALMVTDQFESQLKKLAERYHLNRNFVTYYLFNADATKIQDSITAVHHYNRSIMLQNAQQFPRCWIQVFNGSEQANPKVFANLGSLNRMERTLLLDMALCQQIKSVIAENHPNNRMLDSIFKLYDNYLTDKRSNLFYFHCTALGTFAKWKIFLLKQQWKTVQLSEESDTVTILATVLQKIMAFDLHYKLENAVLIQALTLALQPTALLYDASKAQREANIILSWAQLLSSLDHPIQQNLLSQESSDIKAGLKAIVAASSKKEVHATAEGLTTTMHACDSTHKDGVSLLTVYSNASKAAQIVTSDEKIQQIEGYFEAPPQLDRLSFFGARTDVIGGARSSSDDKSPPIFKKIEY